MKFAGKWMEVDTITLSEVAKIRKMDAPCLSHLWTLALTLQICMFYLEYIQVEKLVMGHVE